MTEERIAVLEAKLEAVISNQLSYKEEAREWRERFCVKQDRLMDKLDDRPCIRHDALLSNVKTQMSWLWAVTGGVILAIIAEWVRGNAQ